MPTRKTDPISSHLAQQAFDDGGGRNAHERIIFDALGLFQNSTATELAEISGLTNVQILRRMTELERKGMVSRGEMRVCHISRRQSLTWATMEPTVNSCVQTANLMD
jgi:hypothetical protein